jgi:hypothetical protein
MRKAEPQQGEQGQAPSPLAGILFLLGGLGSFYGLISTLDPLL